MRESKHLCDLVLHELDELKALDITRLDVSRLTTLCDFLGVASGTSTRHVKSLASLLVSKVKASGYHPIGVEGEDAAEWVLVDLGDVIVHVMLPETRDFYQLEKLWSVPPKEFSDP